MLDEVAVGYQGRAIVRSPRTFTMQLPDAVLVFDADDSEANAEFQV
jgi:hypothetical protein